MLIQRDLPGGPYKAAEIGAAGRMRAAGVLAALGSAHTGDVFDLDAGRWAGMGVLPGHPPFLMTTYRTPRGNDVDSASGHTNVGLHDRTGVLTELLVGTAHTGTHVDALCHVSAGDELFGGAQVDMHLGDSGSRWADIASLAPLVCRGVLIDVAGSKGVSALPKGYAVTAADIEAALAIQAISIRPNDAVLVRTGYMSVWQTAEAPKHYGSGLTLESATMLADAGAVFIAADTEDFEAIPAAPGEPFLPVHRELLVRRGIAIGELFFLEELAARGVCEFLFLCTPLRISGATGSMVRPVAIA